MTTLLGLCRHGDEVCSAGCRYPDDYEPEPKPHKPADVFERRDGSYGCGKCGRSVERRTNAHRAAWRHYGRALHPARREAK